MDEAADFDLMVNQLPFQINNYTFNKILGRGVYSMAFEVYSEKYRQNFCAKVSIIDETILDETGVITDSEFSALISLTHPNVIRMYDCFAFEGYFILILELFEGGTIQDMLQAGKIFSTDEIKALMKGIASALSYCHKSKIAHRDVKPSNIFYATPSNAKLGDFGLSSFLNHGELSNTFCGSIHYIAPEMRENQFYSPFCADVYAFGVTLYQMATGELYDCHGPGFPEELDGDFVDLVSMMLDSDPTKRPTMEEVVKSEFFRVTKLSQLRLPLHASSGGRINNRKLDNTLYSSLGGLNTRRSSGQSLNHPSGILNYSNTLNSGRSRRNTLRPANPHIIRPSWVSRLA